MNMIASATVIRGKGECKAFVNGVAQMDIQRQQEQWRAAASAEIERLRMAEKRANRMSAKAMRLERRAWKEAPGLFERMREAVVDAWALGFATFVTWGEMLGLWVIEGEDGGEAHEA